MSKINRSDIKNLFLKGKMPKENDFHDLIDSTINSIDDGIIKEKGKGFKILSSGPNKEIMSFYDNIKDLTPTWEVNQISDDGDEGFNIQEANGGSRFFIKKGGDIGLGTSTPSSKLDVKGIITSEGRLGAFAYGEVLANGKWQNIITNLNEYNAFEITAVTGTKGAHAIIHAIVVSTYGKSKPGISVTRGRYGSIRNKIDIRWHGNFFNYNLQIRTKKNFGKDVKIKYNVSKLI